MTELTGWRLLYLHRVIIKAVRSRRDAPVDDLVSVGWVSALARGDAEGVAQAQTAYLASHRR